MRRIVLLLSLLLTVALFAQQDSTQVPNSANGWYLSPQGTIRILVIFVEVDYDVHPAKDPGPDGTKEWHKGELPTWKEDLFDPFPLDHPKAMVSRYYHDMSLGNFTVLGDYIDKLVVVRESEAPNLRDYSGMAWAAANKLGALHTAHNLSIADFDMWKDGGKPGLPKVNLPDEPHSYDHVMVILRNSPLPDGNGSTDAGSAGMLFGYPSDTQSRFGAGSALPFGILKHEFNHLLLGGNNFHSGGGNAPTFTSYFIPLQGGWSMMGAANSSLLTACGWDRDRLGWYPSGTELHIPAHNGSGQRVSGDLDPLQGDTGLFIINDFVTSGDVLRIRMPFLPEDEYPQWLWLENHQTASHNQCPTDVFHFEYFDCVKNAVPGIYAMMQVDRNQKTGPGLYGGYSDYLRPVLASGNFDWRLRGDTTNYTCLWPGPTMPYIVRNDAANALTGSQDQEFPLFDVNNDGKISRSEMLTPRIEVRNGVVHDQAGYMGSARHAFTPSGNRKIGMGTNPSSANMLTLVCGKDREQNKNEKPNNRTVRLNGISVELLEQRADGGILVHVRSGDTRLEEDVRWCADSIVLPRLESVSGHSLVVASKRRLLIDRSGTPTRMVAQGTEKGKTWFSPPTQFTILPGADVVLERKAVLDLRNGSEVHVMPGARITLGPKAKLRVAKGCRVVLHGTGELVGEGCSFRKLRKRGFVVNVAM